MSKRVIVLAKGGLGNILFQLFAAFQYSFETQRAVSFKPVELRICVRDIFPNLRQCEINDLSNYPVLNCNTYHTDRLRETADIVVLDGLFQDYRIIDSRKEEFEREVGVNVLRQKAIAKLSSPQIAYRFESLNLFKKLCSSNDGSITVSLHIRRGDYEMLRCYHLLLTEYYYRNAVLNILSRLGKTKRRVKFLCFYENSSADASRQIIQRIQSAILPLGFKEEYHHFNELTEGEQIADYEEMLAMSYCDHHIIANSTFSWWGAYLDKSADKIVCYPDEFYGHQLYYLSFKGLEVDGWTKISSWDPDVRKCDCVCE